MPLSIHGTNGITFNDGSTQTTRPAVGFRNRIINGDMRIDQRNSGASVTNASSAYTLDRWSYYSSQASKFTIQRNAGSITPPAGFTNYMGITSTSSFSLGASDYFIMTQAIEGFNVSDLSFGTANAKTITLSFWVYSSLTGSFGGVFENSSQSRAYPFSYTIASANTWEQKTITIVGDTSGTWVTDNGLGLWLMFSLGTGSTYAGTAWAWVGSQKLGTTGTASVVGTNGATWYITGVQLEVGSTATDFERRPYGTELALCQRYYESGGGNTQVQWSGNTTSSFLYYAIVYFKVQKRATPTITTINNANLGFSTTPSTSGGADTFEFRLDRTANATNSGGYFGDAWTASSEL